VKSFDAELLIRNASDGKKYLYDIVTIKENTADAKSLLEREGRKAAARAASHSGISDTEDTTKSNESQDKSSLAQNKVCVKYQLAKIIWRQKGQKRAKTIG